MSNKYKIVLVTLCYLFVGTIPAISQTATNSDSNLSRIPDLKMETVNGEQVHLGETQNQVHILFLLSKPSSMSMGKKLMKDVRHWMKILKTKYKKCVNSTLIVEPFKTSFPFYNIQKGKLKNETFPVVVDKKGKILEEFGMKESNELSVIVTNGSLKKMQLPGKFGEQSKERITDKVDKMIFRLSEDSKCTDS